MRFRVLHETEYRYATPASESVGELRVCPPGRDCQRVLSRRIEIHPETGLDSFVDCFGNHAEFFSIPYRHPSLRVRAISEVETREPPDVSAALAVTVAEARQIFRSQPSRVWDYIRPSAHTPTDAVRGILPHALHSEALTLGRFLEGLNHWIFRKFAYEPGTTDTTTPLSKVVQQRSGVCQDFAHLFLALIRRHGLPARYVSGYIEAFDPETEEGELVGACASHAWIEAMLPGGGWIGLDPTNDQRAGERHVVVAVGRDYGDAAPVRGTYKGASDQRLRVLVSVEREARAEHPEEAE